MAAVRYIVHDVDAARELFVTHLGFELDEQFGPAIAILSEAGVSFRNEIVRGPGGSQILCEDPSGNPIELFQPAD